MDCCFSLDAIGDVDREFDAVVAQGTRSSCPVYRRAAVTAQNPASGLATAKYLKKFHSGVELTLHSAAVAGRSQVGWKSERLDPS
jgi:hypothetical protein